MTKSPDGQWLETCIWCQRKELGGSFDRPQFAEELERLGWIKGFYGRKCNECVKESSHETNRA